MIIPTRNFNRNHDKLFFFLAYEYYAQTGAGSSARRLHVVRSHHGHAQWRFQRRQPEQLSAAEAARRLRRHWCRYQQQEHSHQRDHPGQPVQPDRREHDEQALSAAERAIPQQNNGDNYLYSTTHTDNMWQIRPRIDWSINDNTKLFVSYNAQREVNHDNSTLWWGTNPAVPYPSPQTEPNYSDSISVNLTKVFSPTLTNEVIFTYTNLYVAFHLRRIPAKINAQNLGIYYKHIFNRHVNNQIPAITGWSDGIANLINPSGYEKKNTLYANKWLPTLRDNISKVWGTHTAKFGFYWERTKNQQPSDNYVNGEQVYANWGQGSTGNAYADMLTGIMAAYAESNFDPVIAMHYTSIDFFAHGLLEGQPPLDARSTVCASTTSVLGWTKKGIGAAVFIPSLYNANSAPAAALTGFAWNNIDNIVPLSGTKGRAFFYEPRFGIAYDVFGTGKTVLRGGMRSCIATTTNRTCKLRLFSLAAGSLHYTGSHAFKWRADHVRLHRSITGSQVSPGGVRVLDLNDTEQPLTTSYSFTVSQRLPWASTAEFSYVGNMANYLNNASNGTFGNINAMPFGGLFSNPSIFGTATAPRRSAR